MNQNDESFVGLGSAFVYCWTEREKFLDFLMWERSKLESSQLQGCRSCDTWTSLGIKPLTRLLEHASWYLRRWIGFMDPNS